MRKPFFIRFVLALGVALSIALLTSDAWAIPVFARKYQTACTTCHFIAFPQLNAFGKAFRDSGYRMPDDEVYVKESPVAMGAEPWKRLFPSALWPSDIPGIPPLSLALKSEFKARPHNPVGTGKTSFGGVGEVELLSAGNFGESLSFFAALALFEKNDFAPSRTELERAFFIYTPQFWGLSHHVNLQVGRFEPRAAPFRNHVSLLGSFIPDYANTWAVIPASNMTTFYPSQNGVELFGSYNGPGGKGGLRWAAGVVNGEPTDPAIDGFGALNGGYPGGGTGNLTVNTITAAIENRWTGHLDVNNAKDFYARAEYKIGGMGVLGAPTTETSLKASQNWQDPSVTLGTFFYRGTTGAFRTFTGGATSGFDDNANHFWRYGGEATVNWWNIELTGAATFYRDNVTGNVTWVDGRTGSNFNTDIYTLRLDWVALPWLVTSYRFENVNPNYDVGDWPSINRHTALITAAVRANVKVYTGATFVSSSSIDSTKSEGSPFDDQYVLGLLFAF